MDLGSSIRRRRKQASGGGKTKKSKGSSRKGAGRTLRVLGLAVLISLSGYGAGYLLATQVAFPLPPAPPELQDVPDLRDTSLDEATSALAAAGLIVGEVESVRHPSVPTGHVLGQDPLPGQVALPDAAVSLTVSLGPEVRAVPDVTRLRGDRATTVLAATGFTVIVDSVESDSPAGRVIEIQPSAGTDLGVPGEVRLLVSLGPPPFAMPALIGIEESEALARLDSLGLVVSSLTTRMSLRDSGEIIEQHPAPETMVELGSAVRLVVGESPLRRIRD